MPDSCPITCPCRRGGDGAALLAACAFVAAWSPVFLGGDFGIMVTRLVHPPHALSPALALWIIAAAIGLGLMLIGLRALFRKGDSAPALTSLVVTVASAIALVRGWYLPHDWGLAWSLGSQGLYLVLIAGGAANLCLALGRQVWMAGYVAAGAPYASPRVVPFDPDRWRAITGRQKEEIARLETANRELADHARELEAVLRDPAVKRAVLNALHPDTHPAVAENDRRRLTTHFQSAAALFARLEKEPRP